MLGEKIWEHLSSLGTVVSYLIPQGSRSTFLSSPDLDSVCRPTEYRALAGRGSRLVPLPIVVREEHHGHENTMLPLLKGCRGTISFEERLERMMSSALRESIGKVGSNKRQPTYIHLR